MEQPLQDKFEGDVDSHVDSPSTLNIHPLYLERKLSITQTSQADDASCSAGHPSVLIGQSGVFREFASATMLRMLFHERTITKETMEPFVNTYYASILFADISGFTRLSASLSEEKLRLHINNYFSKIIHVIQEHSGDVVKFCGDALMIVWPVDKNASPEVQAVTVQMATGCGLHLLHDSAAWNDSLDFNVSVSSPTQRLGLHCGVASGPMHCMCVGEHDRWEFLVSGSVVNHVGIACSEAKNGELYLSKDAHALVTDRINCVEGSNNCFKVDQSAGVFAHIPRQDGKNALQRTWSSYPEVGLPDSDSPRNNSFNHNIFSSPGKKKASLPNAAEDSPGSSILTFGSSPLKSPAQSSSTAAVTSPQKIQSGDSRKKSEAALANLKMSFSNALAREPSSRNVVGRGAASGSHLSVTALARDASVSSTPRYLSLDDLKAQKGTDAAFVPRTNDLEDREWSKGSSAVFCSTHLDDDCSPYISRSKLQSTIKSPSAASASSMISSGGKPGRMTQQISVKTIDEDLEDEALFMQVEVDTNISSNSSEENDSKSDSPIFQDNEYVLEAKNYLAGYLKREESDSLYEYEGMNQVLRCFVQEPARMSVERGTTSLMAELRVVVTMFIEVIGLEKDFNKGSIRRPQLVLRFMLACLRHFGGGLRQYIVDDKGCVLICGFGLPGFSHVDNCARAVETAVAMKRLLLASKLDCKIGISEGRAYCGLVGSSDRCEYAMMGKSVNLAARMMAKSKAGQIIVGEEVYARTTDKFVYSTMHKIRAKGYMKPLAVFCPVERVQLHNGIIDNANEDGCRKVQEFIGREQEISFFDSALLSFSRYDASVKGGGTLDSPFCYIIEGDMGMGKTWLVGEVCYMASQNLEIENILIAAAESPQSYSATQYDTIRQLIVQIFGFTSDSNFEEPSHAEPRLTPYNLARELQPASFGDHPDSPTESGKVMSPCESSDKKADISIENRPQSTDSLKGLHSPGTSRPTSTNRAGLIQSAAGLSSKFSINSEASVDIAAYLSMTQFNMSPKHERNTPRRLHSIDQNDESNNANNQSKHSLHISRVMEWVSKNVGDEDVLTARISSIETSTPNTISAAVKESRATQSESFGMDSFETSTVKSEDLTSQSDIFSDRSLEANGARAGKIVTRKVHEMLPLLNGLLNIELPMNEEVIKLSKEDSTIMLNVLLIFIVTRTVERSKTLLVVEHLQWCDHYSMYIILQSLKIAKSEVFFVGTLRSTSGIKNREDILGRRSKYLAELVYFCSHHVLYPFTLNEIKSTLESALGPVFNLSNPDIMSNHNLSTIMDRSDGSPLLVCCLCFEIANAIKEGTFIDIDSLPCGRRDDLIDMFDLLGHSDQVTLKVASVIGRSFTFQEMCFLLVMLGLSDFIVDLEAALQRMMETGFIEEYHMESKTQANILGNLSDSSFDEIISSGSPKMQHLRRYRFTNNSVHENVYNLMLEEHREVAHTFLGAYLEPYLAQKPALFDRAVFHFIRSGNISKKIEYLCKAAEVSRIAGNIRDVYFYFGELVQLSTGLKVQDLLAFCLISVDAPARCAEDLKNSILSRVGVARHIHDLPPYVCLGRRWISGGDFQAPVYSLVEEISVENVCRWIGEMGVILFKLGSLQASANLIKLALYGMHLPVALGPDIGLSTVGKLSTLISSQKCVKDTAVGTVKESSNVNKKPRLWKSLSSVFSSSNSKVSLASTSLPDNVTTLKLAMSLFEHLVMINILHGTTANTTKNLQYCSDIKSKICHIMSAGIHYERNSAVSFVDRIIDPDEVLEVEEETRLRYFNNSALSSIGQSLRSVIYRSKGIKKMERGAKSITALRSVTERDLEIDTIGETYNSPSSAGNNSNSVYSLSSVSYEQTTPSATPGTMSTKQSGTPNTTDTPTDFKGKYIARNGQNSVVVFEQAVFLLDKAMSDASSAKFNTCLLCLRRGAVLLSCLSDEVGGTIRQFVHLFQAWCSFASGHGSRSKVLLEVISKVVSVYEQATLYKWAVELRALKLVFGPSEVTTVSAVHELMKQLREILKSDKPTACSSSILALHYACDKNPCDAVIQARYAILKLIPRDAVTFIAPIFLFVAGFAAAICMELYISVMVGGIDMTGTPPLADRTSRNLSSELCEDSSQNRVQEKESWIAEAQRSSQKAKRRLQFAEECVSMAQDRLKSIYKTSQPCIVTLYRALKIKHMLCNAVLNKTINKLPYSSLMSDTKTVAFTEFSFGHAFLRLEQLNLSTIYNAERQKSKDFALTRAADTREVAQFFQTLGCPKVKLEAFGLHRFDSSSSESLGNTMRSAHSMSSTCSEGHIRFGSSNAFDDADDLRRISRLVTQYRPVDGEDYSPKDIL